MKDNIDRWHTAITPPDHSKPWALGPGGSWDMFDVKPIPDEMLAELAQRYHYAGAPWNCRSMPLSPADREYMYLLYYSMQGLVARMRAVERLASAYKIQRDNLVGLIQNAEVKSGVCCCGSDMDKHGMYDGHNPIDMWDHSVLCNVEEIQAFDEGVAE